MVLFVIMMMMLIGVKQKIGEFKEEKKRKANAKKEYKATLLKYIKSSLVDVIITFDDHYQRGDIPSVEERDAISWELKKIINTYSTNIDYFTLVRRIKKKEARRSDDDDDDDKRVLYFLRMERENFIKETPYRLVELEPGKNSVDDMAMWLSDLNEKYRWLQDYLVMFDDHYANIVQSIVIEDEEDAGIDNIELNNLSFTSIQMEAFRMISASALRASSRVPVDDTLESRVKYIRECPIVIHLAFVIVLQKLINSKDDHYRNQYETSTSGGCTILSNRSKWETRIFNGYYDDAEPGERVKYGTILLTGESVGNRRCIQYGGKSHLIMRDHVKARSTIAARDSSNHEIRQLATYQHCNHIVSSFDESELDYIDEKIDGEEWPHPNPFDESSHYKEIHIHGDVTFSHDVEKIMIDADIGDHAMIKKLLKKFFRIIGTDIDYEFIP